MEQIAQRVEASGQRAPGQVDVAIIGSGPAGLAATLLAHERGLRYLTLEQSSLGGTVAHFPRGKLVMTQPARLPMVGTVRFGETRKEALIDFWSKVEVQTGIRIRYGERLERLERSADGFELVSDRGRYRSTFVLLAIGRRGTPRRLGVPGEELSKVVYSLADPAEYADRRVLVVGGGDSALEAALSLTEQPGTQVTLSYRGSAFTRAKRKNREAAARLAESGAVRMLMESEVVEIGPGQVAIEHRGRSLDLPNDAVIICAGGVLPGGFLREIGVSVETKYGQA